MELKVIGKHGELGTAHSLEELVALTGPAMEKGRHLFLDGDTPIGKVSGDCNAQTLSGLIEMLDEAAQLEVADEKARKESEIRQLRNRKAMGRVENATLIVVMISLCVLVSAVLLYALFLAFSKAMEIASAWNWGAIGSVAVFVFAIAVFIMWASAHEEKRRCEDLERDAARRRAITTERVKEAQMTPAELAIYRELKATRLQLEEANRAARSPRYSYGWSMTWWQ